MLTVDPRPHVILELSIHEFGTVAWTDEDHVKAERDGWYLDHQDGLVQADPENRKFQDEDAVESHLAKKIRSGCQHAIRAMIFNRYAAVLYWFKQLEELKDG